MCNKQQHTSLLKAQAQALSLIKHKKINPKRIRIYECDKCGCYHVTRMTVKEYLKIKKKS